MWFRFSVIGQQIGLTRFSDLITVSMWKDLTFP